MHIHRVFMSGILTLLFLSPAWAGVNEGAYEVLENGAGKFKIDIQNCPVASANVESISIDDIIIDIEELTPEGSDVRVYGPGDAHFGNLTIRSRAHDGNELFQWWLDSSRDDFVRKSITIEVLDKKDQPARRYHFFECYPLRWDPGEYSPSSQVAVETIVCKMQRVELASNPPPDDPGKPKKLKRPKEQGHPGFTIAIEAERPGSGGSGTDVDSAWESCTGGALNIEVSDSSVGTDPFHAATPGHKSVTELILDGTMTASRKVLCDWVNTTVQGEPWKQNVTITEIGKAKDAGKVYTYTECFPTRYVFPNLSASGTGNLKESIVMKPNRMER
jgi:phage tail-like protein